MLEFKVKGASDKLLKNIKVLKNLNNKTSSKIKVIINSDNTKNNNKYFQN